MSHLDFDALSTNAYAQGGNNIQALDKLWTSAFGLEKWYFIARGQAPNFRPYVGYKKEAGKDVPVVYAFTDEDRLEAMARELKLVDPQGNIQVMTIPTKNIVNYLVQFGQVGVKGVWFNPNGSGFYATLEALPQVKARVDTLLA